MKSKEGSMLEVKDRYYLPLVILLLCDFIIIGSTFLAAYYFRFYTGFYQWFPPPKPSYIPQIYSYGILSLLISSICVFIFERFGIYEQRIGLDRQVRSGTIILAILVAYIFIMALLFNYRGTSYSRLTIALAIPFTCITVVLVHHLLKKVHFLLVQKGIVFQKTLLVGPEWRCMEVFQKLQEHHGSQYQILGYASSDEIHTENPSFLRCLGSVFRLSNLLQSFSIDQVIIAMPPQDHEEILKIIRVCKSYGIRYRLIPELFDLICRRVQVEEIGEVPQIVFGETPLYGFGQVVKRSMDIILAGMALILSVPVAFVIAMLIKLDSPGSILYVQERIGNDGKKFKIYKFRSMIDQAEKDTGPAWATRNDPRTTRIGRFIRRYNLDELPQLINVIRGDMSLVGPRPERPYFVNKFKGAIPLYMRRHMVKTGITGWAQVNGLRGDTSVEERTRYDLYYVENWSVLFDLKILWKTLSSFKNAY